MYSPSNSTLANTEYCTSIFLCPPPVKAKDAICNLVVMSVSVIGIRGMRRQRAYRPRRLAAVAASCSGAATRHVPWRLKLLLARATWTQTFPPTGIQFAMQHLNAFINWSYDALIFVYTIHILVAWPGVPNVNCWNPREGKVANRGIYSFLFLFEKTF